MKLNHTISEVLLVVIERECKIGFRSFIRQAMVGIAVNPYINFPEIINQAENFKSGAMIN